MVFAFLRTLATSYAILSRCLLFWKVRVLISSSGFLHLRGRVYFPDLGFKCLKLTFGISSLSKQSGASGKKSGGLYLKLHSEMTFVQQEKRTWSTSQRMLSHMHTFAYRVFWTTSSLGTGKIKLLDVNISNLITHTSFLTPDILLAMFN